MSPVRGFGPACTCGCGRPARELGNFSTSCWMGLAPRERHMLQWEASTVQFDVVAEAEQITRRAS